LEVKQEVEMPIAEMMTGWNFQRIQGRCRGRYHLQCRQLRSAAQAAVPEVVAAVLLVAQFDGGNVQLRALAQRVFIAQRQHLGAGILQFVAVDGRRLGLTPGAGDRVLVKGVGQRNGIGQAVLRKPGGAVLDLVAINQQAGAPAFVETARAERPVDIGRVQMAVVSPVARRLYRPGQHAIGNGAISRYPLPEGAPPSAPISAPISAPTSAHAKNRPPVHTMTLKAACMNA
jgi:hypothetical protein